MCGLENVVTLLNKTFAVSPGFCRRDHQRLTYLADRQAHQVSWQLVNLALDHHCQAIAVESQLEVS